MKIINFSSSLTCVLTIGGLPIGGLQDVSFSENFNIKQVNSLGRAYSNTFIPGFFNGELRVKKVFLEQDLLSDALFYTMRANVSSAKEKDNLNDINKINDFFTYIKPSESYDDLIYSLFFEVLIYDNNSVIIAKIMDCIIDQRTTSISISNTIIMEDVVFKFKSIDKTYNT
jgi:hypothetical protein